MLKQDGVLRGGDAPLNSCGGAQLNMPLTSLSLSDELLEDEEDEDDDEEDDEEEDDDEELESCV